MRSRVIRKYFGFGLLGLFALAIAGCEVSSGSGTSSSGTTAASTPPTITVSSPGNGDSFYSDEGISFVSIAKDQNGTLINTVQWVSQLDGVLGSGRSITSSLSVGEHRITATVTDNSTNLKDSDTRTLTVTDRSVPVIESATTTGTVTSIIADSNSGYVHVAMNPPADTSKCFYGLAQLGDLTSDFEELMFASLSVAKASGSQVTIHYDINVPSNALCSIWRVDVVN